MKKNFIICFVLSFFLFLGMNFNVKAEGMCEYKIENFYSINEYHRWYSYILNKLGDKTINQDSMDIYFRNFADELNSYMTTETIWDLISPIAGTTVIAGDYTENISDSRLTGIIDFYKTEKYAGYEGIRRKNLGYKEYFRYLEEDINASNEMTCADMVLLKIDAQRFINGEFSEKNPFLTSVYRINFDQNKNISGRIPDDFNVNNKNEIYLLAINKNSDIYNYYKMKKHDLYKRKSNFEWSESYNIEKIFDLYKSYNFDYKKVYDLLNKNEGQINDNIIKQLSDEITKIPYFNNSEGSLTSEQIAKYIWNDIEVLQRYQNDVIVKMFEEQIISWKTTGEGVNKLEDLFSIIEKYENKDYARYVKTTYEFLYALIKDDASKIKIVLDAKFDNDIKKAADNKCNDPQKSDEQQRQCKNEQCELLNFNCDNYQNPAYFPQSAMEQIILSNSASNCNDDKSCIVNQCKSFQKKAKNICQNAVAGESEKQKKLENIADEIAQDVLTKIGFNIDDDGNDLCTFLFETDDPNVKPLYYYIVLVLNIIRIAGPILVIALTSFDGMKTISSFQDDASKKFWGRLKIRLICLAILILVPTILKFSCDLFEEKVCEISDLENAYYDITKIKN